MKFSIVHADCTLLVNEMEICDIFNSAEKSALKVSVAKLKHLTQNCKTQSTSFVNII